MFKKGVCILLATYNGGKYIKTQLDSILNQTVSPDKILISDDGSTDNTAELLKEYSHKYGELITLLEKDVPCGNARDNFMFLASKCDYEYAMFCDQDDYWHKNKIELTLNKMNELKNSCGEEVPLLVHTDLRVVDSDMNEISSSFAKMSGIALSGLSFEKLLVQNAVTGCTMMVNNTLLKYACSVYNKSEMLMHDWWFALIAAAFGAIGTVDEATIDYRQHGDNSVGAKDVKKASYILSKIKDGGGIRQSLQKTAKQAALFAESFKDTNSRCVCVAREYGNIFNLKKGDRIKTIRKYRLYKQGLSRRVAQFIWC